MKRMVAILLGSVLAVSCAAPSPAAQSGSAAPSAPAAPKRISVAALVDPSDWRDNRARPFVPGLTMSGLTVEDETGARRAQLAEAVPTTENGLWRVFPDGRMETTYRLREGVRWHDGAPMTSDDLLFTMTVVRDRDVTGLYDNALSLVDGIEAPDARTVVVRWRQPFIDADSLFTFARMRPAFPLPKHLLERQYLENKAGFDSLAYWTTELVSSGPFKVKEWAPSSHALVTAFPEYVLGRPKIDEIEIKFILDANTMLANVLAGAVDLTASRALSIEQGATARERWSGGRMGTSTEGWTMMYPQHHHPSPYVGEPQFRRALAHAVDRQQLADELTLGNSPVAHAIISPDQAQYRAVESSIVRYDFDPRRAIQILEGMGLTRGGDGVFRDASGERPTPKIQTTVNDTSTKTMLATVDYWKQIGLAAEGVVLTAQAAGQREVRYGPSFSGFDLVNQGHGVEGISNLLHSSAAPLPERNYEAPNAARNRGSYVNPDYDALMDRYMTTIAIPERTQLLAQLVQRQTDLNLVMGFFYSVNAVMISNRLQNAIPATSWNAHEWDLTG